MNTSTSQNNDWRTKKMFLILISILTPIAFATWTAMLNNFAIEKINFTGADIGLLQTVREIPGLLAFTAAFILLFIREQRFMIIALLLLSVGVMLTGFFTSFSGILCTTLLMSTGFHYFETLKQSLSLQWLTKEEAPEVLGKLISIGALASLCTYGVLWCLLTIFKLDYKWIYLLAGSVTFILSIFIFISFPTFKTETEQTKKLVMRKRYWLYYAITFLAGARRQIFTVFAAFLMVEKFGYSAANITLLFMCTYLLNWLFAKRIGRLIGVIGEQKSLVIEYSGLIIIFIGYAVVENSHIAAGLYLADHLFFGLALARKTYLQKIADPADLSSTASISFTINHIAAVVIPVLFGLLWMNSHAIVFYTGTALAFLSLILALNVPANPREGNEVRYFKWH